MKIKEIYQYSLATVIVVGFFALLYLLATQAIPAENKDSMNLVIGSLLAAFGGIVGYFFGSSLGSSKKTELLNDKK